MPLLIQAQVKDKILIQRFIELLSQALLDDVTPDGKVIPALQAVELMIDGDMKAPGIRLLVKDPNFWVFDTLRKMKV